MAAPTNHWKLGLFVVMVASWGLEALPAWALTYSKNKPCATRPFSTNRCKGSTSDRRSSFVASR